MKNALVLMTALIPTTGHADLIKFAASLPNIKVNVLINGRSFEPYSTETRTLDLQEHFKKHENVLIKYSIVDNAPQNPEDMKEGFWVWWKDEINENFPEVNEQWDYVVASEPYGENVARSLKAQFLPYDIQRTLNSARGSNVRSDLWNNWENIIKETRQNLQLRAVMFSQESVGKTTLSKIVSENLKADWIPEYARPYLETVGSEITEEKMLNIHAGQAALQTKAYSDARKPVLVMDTDLFSTVGYYEIMGVKESPERLRQDALRLSADIYYVLPDDIPFEEDDLRYGGDKRESDMNLWIKILKENRLNYIIVPKLPLKDKAEWIMKDILERFERNTEDIKTFERD